MIISDTPTLQHSLDNITHALDNCDGTSRFNVKRYKVLKQQLENEEIYNLFKEVIY
jgi:hypothetical protein